MCAQLACCTALSQRFVQAWRHTASHCSGRQAWVVRTLQGRQLLPFAGLLVSVPPMLSGM